MRILKCIRQKLLSWYNNKLLQLIYKAMCSSERGEQPDHWRERVNMHLIIFLHHLYTQYGILQMDMRLMRQRSKLKSMKRKMNHWSGKTSWSGWVLCLMVLFFMSNPVSRNACSKKLAKIYQEHQIHQADFVLMNLT